MLNDIVLVRALDGEPVKLVAVEKARGIVYAANPKSLDRVAVGESWPIGFPEEDVFSFDEQAYRQLLDQWQRTHRLDRGQWHALGVTRYSRAAG